MITALQHNGIPPKKLLKFKVFGIEFGFCVEVFRPQFESSSFSWYLFQGLPFLWIVKSHVGIGKRNQTKRKSMSYEFCARSCEVVSWVYSTLSMFNSLQLYTTYLLFYHECMQLCFISCKYMVQLRFIPPKFNMEPFGMMVKPSPVHLQASRSLGYRFQPWNFRGFVTCKEKDGFSWDGKIRSLDDLALQVIRWSSGVGLLLNMSMLNWWSCVHTAGQIIATSHDLTPNGGLVREIPLFQGNLGWWNIIIWPDILGCPPSQ